MHRTFGFALTALAIALMLSSCDQLRQVSVDQAGDYHENSEGSADDPVPLALDAPHDGKVDGYDSDHRATANSYYSFRTTTAGTYFCCVSNLSCNDSTYYYPIEIPIEVSASRSFSSPVFSGSATFGAALSLEADTEYFVRISNAYNGYEHSEGFTFSIAILSSDRGEGAPGSPVPIEAGTARACVVGKKYGANASSYYSFTAPADGLYAWSLGYEDKSCVKTVYRDDGYTVKAAKTDTPAIPLAAGETAFLKVENTRSSVPVPFKTLISRSGDRESDGTEHNPVQLELATPYPGKIGAEGISRYTFTTSTAGLYTCSVTGNSSSSYYTLTLYSDPECTTEVGWQSTSSYTLPYNLPAQTAYYVLIDNGGSSPIAYTINVSRSSDAANDGYPTRPVPLEIGVSFAGKIGDSNGPMGKSWYSFTTGEAGAYAVRASGSSGTFEYKLYSKPDFSTTVTDLGNSKGIPGVLLSASTTYYLKVTGYSPATSYSLMVSRLGDALSEGSVSSPVPLDLGVPHDGRVDASSNPNGDSYYSFTAHATGKYDFAITNLESWLDFDLYENPSFTGTAIHDYGDTGIAGLNLVAGTTYYLLVSARPYAGPCSYTITVNKK